MRIQKSHKIRWDWPWNDLHTRIHNMLLVRSHPRTSLIKSLKVSRITFSSWIWNLKRFKLIENPWHFFSQNHCWLSYYCHLSEESIQYTYWFSITFIRFQSTGKCLQCVQYNLPSLVHVTTLTLSSHQFVIKQDTTIVVYVLNFFTLSFHFYCLNTVLRISLCTKYHFHKQVHRAGH